MSERELLQVEIVGMAGWLSAEDVCRLCRIELAVLIELADLGLIAPRGATPDRWELEARELPRLRVAGRLMHDLGLNVSGAALAVELLAARRSLEQRVRNLERLLSDS